MTPWPTSDATPAVAVFGTGSDVGKSLVAAGLCRILARAGIRVAPFKAQNMSLNSSVTPEGAEIGRAQALQAEACGIPPHADMNPILLKPESDGRSQIVLCGRVYGKTDAEEYFTAGGITRLRPRVEACYRRLAGRFDAVVIEGAGSAAEINLRDKDLVNWPVAAMADAAVLLVGDIDRGGVFAQLIGTLDLLAPEERARVRGLIVNKFRGDLALFTDGVRMLETRTGIPVLGVLPHLRDLALDEEDHLDLRTRPAPPFARDRVNIAVLLLPRLSNFTDFNALAGESDVSVRYVATPEESIDADIIILPGTKTTLHDLEDLRARGFAARLLDHVKLGGELLGICGGYQMLGRRILDPDGVESGGAGVGLGFLDVTTSLGRTKITKQVTATCLGLPGIDPLPVRGYQIHMGRTERQGHAPCFRIDRGSGTASRQGETADEPDCRLDGAMRDDGLVWGSYLHGLFDQAEFRRAWLNRARVRKGLMPREPACSFHVDQARSLELDRWADHVQHHLRLDRLWEFVMRKGMTHENHQGLHQNR